MNIHYNILFINWIFEIILIVCSCTNCVSFNYQFINKLTNILIFQSFHSFLFQSFFTTHKHTSLWIRVYSILLVNFIYRVKRIRKPFTMLKERFSSNGLKQLLVLIIHMKIKCRWKYSPCTSSCSTLCTPEESFLCKKSSYWL